MASAPPDTASTDRDRRRHSDAMIGHNSRQRYDLAAMTKRTGRKRVGTLRPIQPTQALAADLYVTVYKRIIVGLTSALPHIVAAYGRSVPALTTDSATDEVQSALNSLSDFLNRLTLTLAPELRDWAMRVEKWHRGKWRGSVLSATGVDLDTILLGSGTPTSVQETIDWNTALVKDVSDQARARISSAVFAGFRQRLPATDVARQLREGVDLSRKRSLNIASDQLSKLSAALDRERQTDAGIDQFIWRRSRKRHPRAIHVAHNGKTYDWDNPPVTNGRPDLPGDLPFCGCRAEAVLNLD